MTALAPQMTAMLVLSVAVVGYPQKEASLAPSYLEAALQDERHQLSPRPLQPLHAFFGQASYRSSCSNSITSNRFYF